MTPARISLREYGLAAAMVLGVISMTLFVQEPTTMEGGLGWDEVVYHAMASSVVGSEIVAGPAPFVYRIGLPTIAAWVSPGDLKFGFLAVSIPAIVLAALAVYLLLCRYIATPWVRLLCLALYLGAFHGMPRFIPFRPFMVDAPATLCLFWAIYLVDRYRTERRATQVVLVSLVCFVGAFFRESVVLGAGAMLFVDNPLSRGAWRRGLLGSLAVGALPLLAWSIGTFLAHRLVVAHNVTSAFGTLIVNTVAKRPHTLFLAVALTFGPIVLAPLFAFRYSTQFLWARQHLLALLAGAVLLSIPGGSDTERLMYWGAPVAFIMVGRLLDGGSFREHAPWLVVLVALQALSHRWFWTLPQSGPGGGVPLLTMLGEAARYEDLWSSHATRRIRLIFTAEYAAVALVVILWMRKWGPRPITAAT